MKKELARTFQVPESLRVDKLEEQDGKITLHCTAKQQQVLCKHCGADTAGYDLRAVNKRHTVVGGKTIWLRITRRRVQCKNCRKVFAEPLAGISRSEFTNHLTQQIQEKGRGQDCSSVGREMGISCASVCRKMWELPMGKFKTPKKTNSSSE